MQGGRNMDFQLRLTSACGQQAGEGDDFPFLQCESGSCIDIAECEFDNIGSEVGGDIFQGSDDSVSAVTVNFL